MIPKDGKEGLYWVRVREFDNTISDWTVSQFIGNAWEFIGDECGLRHERVVEVGPELVPPSTSERE